VEADISGTMFTGIEWLLSGRHIRDAAYITESICGMCSIAHSACASYLLDQIYDNEINEGTQFLRNTMLGADFLQNHIRHFYLITVPDYVKMPDRVPFHRKEWADLRLRPRQNQKISEHALEAVKICQECHRILTLLGGKPLHQVVNKGVVHGPDSDSIREARASLERVAEFVESKMLPDTDTIARAYDDYYTIGVTEGKFLSFGLFRFGPKNEESLWQPAVLINGKKEIPDLKRIRESVEHTWFREEKSNEGATMAGQDKCVSSKTTDSDRRRAREPMLNLAGGPAGGRLGIHLSPAPHKPGAYSWVKAPRYDGKALEGGPLARMIINGFYQGGWSTMDRIWARSKEAFLITRLMRSWLPYLAPESAVIPRNEFPANYPGVSRVVATTDTMRGPLLHEAEVHGEDVKRYNLITPTAWNFSPKSERGRRGPVETALLGTYIEEPLSQDMVGIVLGRIIRSFDPCLSCGTHVIQLGK